jgi:hypothetical protein
MEGEEGEICGCEGSQALPVCPSGKVRLKSIQSVREWRRKGDEKWRK